MVVRFIEFLTYLERDVCLYVMQEDDGQGGYRFKVSITDGANNEIIMCNRTDNHWKNVTQNIPQWVKEMEPAIISLIERKVDLQEFDQA